jgi:Putative zinc-finger
MEIDKFTGGRTWRCPDEMRLAAFVEQRLAGSEQARVEAHVAGCDYCLGQVGALERLQDAAPPDEVPPRMLAAARALLIGGSRAAKPAWYWGAAAATTACLVLVVTFGVRSPQAVLDSPPQTVRSTADHATTTPELTFPREAAIVPRAALEFRWNRVERALFYEVRVVTADGDLVWETRADQTEARMPAAVRLANGERFYVSVSAGLPEGKTVKAHVVGFQVTGQ